MSALVASKLGVPVPAWHLRSATDSLELGPLDDVAGPVDAASAAELATAPHAPGSSALTSLRYVLREGDIMFNYAERYGEVFGLQFAGGPGRVVVVSNPGHIKSLMMAPAHLAPSATRFSPLRPIIGADSVLTATGDRHRQQRGLLLPHFHGRAVTSYQDKINAATARRLDEWPVGEPVRVVDVGQQITLDVITSAVFGIEGEGAESPAERAVRDTMVRLLHLSTSRLAPLAQLLNIRSREPKGLQRMVLKPLDAAIFRVIDERRRGGADQANGAGRTDILTVLMAARGEDGAPLGDREIRDELLTLVLAGHETTSNTVAWTFERLTRNPDVYRRATEAARTGDRAYVSATISEAMRSRPVVPLVARELLSPWQFGNYAIDSGVVAMINILLLHHRQELYPRPFSFEPERFLEAKLTPHQFMPFGGGNRRCLGAGLAMAELEVVVTEILRRVDLDTTDRPAERPRDRNVTMIPSSGGLVRAHTRA